MLCGSGGKGAGGGRRQRPKRRPERDLLGVRQGPACLGDGGGEDHERRHLGHERLRGSDRDLGACLEEQDRLRLARDRRSDGVRHRDDRAAAFARKASRRDRVGRLARLRHRDDQCPLVERWRAVAELGPDVRPRGQTGPVLESRRADQGRIERGAAGDELDPGHGPEHVFEAGELLDDDAAVLVDPSDDRLAERLGLLVDLLEHEVLVAALLGGLGRPVDRRDRSFAGQSVHAGDRDAPRSQIGDVALLEEHDLVRVGQDRGDIRGEEALAVGQTHHERHVLAGTDETVALTAMHDDDRVRTLDPAQGRRGRRRRDRPCTPLRSGGRSPRYRSPTRACGRGPRDRRAAPGSSR